jgi:hypothetical protein
MTQQPYGQPYPQQYPPQQYPPQQPYPAQAPPQQYAPPAQAAPVAYQQPGYPPMPYGQPPAPPAQPLAEGSLDAFYSQPSASSGPSLSWTDKQGQPRPVGPTFVVRVARDVTSADVQQQTDMRTKAPLFYADGRPKFAMKVPVQLQHPEFPDGEASWYVKGQARDELVRAMSEAGVEGSPKAGAIMQITLVNRRATAPGMNPANVVQIRYTPPQGDQGTAAPSPVAEPQAQQAPVQQYAPPADPQAQQWQQHVAAQTPLPPQVPQAPELAQQQYAAYAPQGQAQAQVPQQYPGTPQAQAPAPAGQPGQGMDPGQAALLEQIRLAQQGGQPQQQG